MGKQKAKQRLDKFYHLAKEQGYRSCDAFKLLQLDSTFRFLPTARAVLDLCAAPGGWMQVAVKHAPVGAFVVGVDLAPIRPIRGAYSLNEDITTPKCRAAVKRLMDSNGVSAFDVVLHDGSPNIGDAWAQEATAQNSLVIDSLRLATQFLAPNGSFITKVFRWQDYNAVVYCLDKLFEKVEPTKPTASRSTSAEIFVVCLRYKAPATIDPRLLDTRHLFQRAAEPARVIDVLGTTKKRNRRSYPDGVTTLYIQGLASEFIWSEAPLEYLGSVNEISFDDPSSLPIKNLECSTDEIISLCEDLGVLDKNSFKHLLKWRLRVRKALSSSSQEKPKSTDVEPEAKVDEDDQLLQEMEELSSLMERKKRKEKKRQAKRLAKDKARKATGMQIDATQDSYHDPDLFSISAIKGNKGLQAVETVELNEEDADGDSEIEDNRAASHGDSAQELDSDEEQKRYDAQLEEMLDEAYEQYCTRRGGAVKQDRKRAKRSDPNDEGDLSEVGEVEMDPEFDEDAAEEEPNPLLLTLDKEKPTKEQTVKQWYDQEIFGFVGSDIAESGIVEDRKRKSPPVSKTQERDVAQQKRSRAAADEEEVEKAVPASKSKEKAGPKKNEARAGKTGRAQQDDFEIVPAEEPSGTAGNDDDDSDSSSSESEFDEDLDDDQKAEILAYAKKMLRKKQREQIIDDGYNRYMFDDEGLPRWFLEEEKRHRQPVKPVTKEEIAAMKAQFREIDARPTKKVAEAKARKKRVAQKQLDKARKKADVIADQNDISEKSKNKMIERLYKKATPKRPQKEYVVAKKGVKVKLGKGKVLVDPRMKKDKRTSGMNKKGKGKGKGGGGKKGKGSGMNKKGGGGGQKRSKVGKGAKM